MRWISSYWSLTQTSKAFLVPQALNAFAVEDASNLLETHQDAEINFLFERPGAQSVFLDGNFVLYGKESRSSTMLPLKPGDAVRMVGTAPVIPVPAGVAYESLGNSVSDRYLGKATMYGYFRIREAGLRRRQRKECEGYESFRNTLGSYKSSNSIEVEVVK